MNLNRLPPLSELLYRFSYDPDSGRLYSRNWYYSHKLGRRVFTDTWREVSCLSKAGYLVTSCAGSQIKAHRICWALAHGEDPYPYVIDHVNRDKADNRISNLRKVTPAENTANRHPTALGAVHSRKPVRITYPDGRGTIITDSLLTAGRLLRRSPTSVKRSLERDGVINWGKGPWAKDSGIRIAWHRPECNEI